MARRKGDRSFRLGVGEIELLEVLWCKEAVTISEAQEALPRAAGYTTVQTRLNRLVAKGAARKSKTRPAKYRAAIGRDQVTQSDLDVLVNRVQGGQVVPLVAHLIRERPLSDAEIDELRSLIDEAEQRGGASQ